MIERQQVRLAMDGTTIIQCVRWPGPVTLYFAECKTTIAAEPAACRAERGQIVAQTEA